MMKTINNLMNTIIGANNPAAPAKDKSQTAALLRVYDLEGYPLELGPKDEKASGGEGTVYTFPRNPKFLVKIYKNATIDDSQKMKEISRRIQDMVNMKDVAKKEEKEFAAWPMMPVLDDKKNVIGFLMRKCEGLSLLSLRGPKTVQKYFPGWNRDNLAITALDFVQKVRQLAEHGVFVNDFNPANFLVDKNGKISFIDCDSFQIRTPQGHTHIARTYFASYVAPELLQNKSLLEKPRNIHHVEFGTALIAFYILMCGLHPYTYFDAAHQSSCGTPDENLLRGRCPLGIGAGCLLPPGGWYAMWSWLTGELKGEFINTFRAEQGHAHPEMRTSLKRLEESIGKLIYTQQRSTELERHDLVPATIKSRDDKRTSFGNNPNTGNFVATCHGGFGSGMYRK